MPTSQARQARPLAVVSAPSVSPSSRASRKIAARFDAPAEASPFIKWAGGKTRLLPQLLPMLPKGADAMRHVEPFSGGAAMFFARRPARAVLADVNPSLVSTYKAVRDHLEDLIENLAELSASHAKVANYYDVRTRYNMRHQSERDSHDVHVAAMFIYLNKTCFNGLHRVNRKGEFNVPQGSYKNPRILDEEALRNANRALQNVDIRKASFEDLIEYARPGDFVYLDPPYVPLSASASFTNYAEEGFGYAEQVMLRDVYAELDRRGCKLMLSNSDTPIVNDLYRGFRIDKVVAPRAISCNGNGRGMVSEVVVRNY